MPHHIADGVMEQVAEKVKPLRSVPGDYRLDVTKFPLP